MLGKNLAYYMQLPYRITVYPPQKADEDWGAEVPELARCTTQAPSWEQLLIMIEEAKEIWLETMIEAGQEIPEPEVVS
jgi:predicted RNase H-like HicB family nuclease